MQNIFDAFQNIVKKTIQTGVVTQCSSIDEPCDFQYNIVANFIKKIYYKMKIYMKIMEVMYYISV